MRHILTTPVIDARQRNLQKPSSNRKALNQALAAIEASKDTPKLVGLKDFIENAAKGNPEKETNNQ